MAYDATKGMSDAQIMKKIIKDATKGKKGEEKEKAIRDLFVKVMPKPSAVTGKKVRTPAKKMNANMGGMAKKYNMGGTAKKKMMGGGYAMKKKK